MIGTLCWTTQPQVAVGVNRANPICAGISSLLNIATRIDVATNAVWSVESGATLHPINGSVSLACNGSSNAGMKPPITGGSGTIMSASTYTLMLLVRVNSLGSRRIILADYDVTGATAGISIEQTSANLWWMQQISTVPQQIPVSASATSVTTGWHWLEIVFVQSVAFNAYVDGVNITNETSSAVLNPRRSGPDYRVGRPGAYPSLGFDGDVAFHGAWNRALSDAERASIRTNPWQLFSPLRRKVIAFAPTTAAQPKFRSRTIFGSRAGSRGAV